MTAFVAHARFDQGTLLAMDAPWSPAVLALWLGCSPTPTAVSPATSPPAGPSSPASTQAPAGASGGPAAAPAGGAWTAFDPRVVRCGVDDRPGNVLGLAVPRRERALLADRAFPPSAGRPAFKPNARLKQPFRPDEPPRALRIQRPTLTLGGAPLPPALQAAFAAIDPQYEVCASLVDEGQPELQLEFDLELASSGALLRVLPIDQRNPGAFERCVMERSCQYQARVVLGRSQVVRALVNAQWSSPGDGIGPR